MAIDLEKSSEPKPDKINNYLAGKGKEDLLLVTLSLVTGIIFDTLFYGKALGVSYPLFTITFLSFFFYFWKKYGSADTFDKINSIKKDKNLLLLILIVLLSLTFLIFSNSFLATLNFILIPVLIIAFTVLITGNNSNAWYKPKFINDILYNAVFQPLKNTYKPLKISFLTIRLYFPELSSEKYSVAKKVMTGLFVSIPLLTVIIFLLASADNIFNNSLNRFAWLLENIEMDYIVEHSIIIGCVSLLISGYLWSLFNSPAVLKTGNTDSASPKSGSWDPIVTATVLVLADLIYFLFCFIQFSYLFGGTAHLASGYTYSDYARKGFFELIIVTLINLSILTGSITFIKKENKLTTNIVRTLLSFLVLFTGIMLYSAHFRMALYEEAYGYTYLRLYVHVFMFMLFTWFGLALYRVWKDGFQLLKLFLASALNVYTCLNYLNVDKIIAQNNVERFTKINTVDILYLQDLSYDAIPSLIKLSKISGNEYINNSIKDYLYKKKLKLNRTNDWQSYNISRENAKQLLATELK